MRTMKTIGCLAFVSMLSVCAIADQQTIETKGEKTWTGTLSAVSTEGHSVAGKGFWSTKVFNIGDHCSVAALDKNQASLTDLHPGDRVEIRYRNEQGVLVAYGIAVKPLSYRGLVRAVDKNARIVTMQGAAQKKFEVPTDCKVTLWNGNTGTLDDLKPGDALTVTYETPGGLPVACRIQGHSLTFVGTVEAVDLADRTVRAKEFMGKKNFHLGSGCRISDGTRDDLNLKDLALGGKYTFTYVDVDGVAVADHISPAPHPAAPTTASAR
jgi:hypothetical protein